MSLAPGARLGAYQVTALIGEGGMGKVWQATDTTLDRQVAIKVLPDAFAADADRLARFEREAKTLASLNHPHIAAIYGFEKSSGAHALVMELVEGEDLSQRLARGALPLNEALPIAKQIAEALEAAHEQGIIHRDLKPANIKVREDGTVKVLDFGLAKALEPAGAMSSSVTQSPTITSPALMTGAGLILGTAAYMSPEQARGKPAGMRSDIWAFGCVLYEMLTGKRAFEGEDVSDTLASVLRGEPKWTALPASTPAAIHRVLRRCLEKDHRRRLASIADARMDIDDALAEPAPTPTAAGSIWRSRSTAIVAGVAATVAIGLTVLVLRVLSPQHVSPDRPVMRLELNLPAGVEAYVGHAQAAALSPDAMSVAFVGLLNGTRQLFFRRLDQFEATPLARGSGVPIGCFFSPDGRSLGFIDVGSRTLKKLSLADGLVVPLASDVDSTAGGVWGPDDRVTFTREGALWQVPSAGGAATQLTRLEKGKGELSHAWPTLTPDGKVLLFAIVTGSSRDAAHIEALTLATGRRQVVVDPGRLPLYASSGHLIFFRNNALLAVGFDVNRLAVTGSPIRVLDQLPVMAYSGAPVVALSNAGGLVYPPSVQATKKIVWVSRQGVEQPLYDEPRQYINPRLGPEGQRVVVGSGGDLWILDKARKTFPRLTSNATAGNDFPVWTPDGTRVIFRTQTGLAWIAADGSGGSGTIAGTSVNDYPSSVSPDGATLAFIRITSETSGDVYALSLRGEPNPRSVVKGPAYEGGPQFSPNRRWLAYVSDASGQPQVFVRPFPGPGGPVTALSTQGGTQPRWNPNGKELFYRNGNRMMVVDVTANPDLVLSPPRVLFEQRYSYGVGGTTPNYDVSPDGQHFVMVKDESTSGRLNVVLNWTEELKRLVPTN